MDQGAGYTIKPMPPTGIKGTYNAATAGPGSGRTIMPSGSQGEYNPGPKPMRTNPMPAGRDILSEYGKDSPTARNKR